MATEKKAVSVYVEKALFDRLASYANDEGRSISNLIEHTLRQAFPPEGEILTPV